jgi:hypothetical protein
MLKKRLVAILVGLALVGVGFVRPTPARADDTAVIVVGAIAAYAIFVAIGAWVIYGRQSSSEWSDKPPDLRDAAADRGGVRFGSRCPPTADGPLPVACW